MSYCLSFFDDSVAPHWHKPLLFILQIDTKGKQCKRMKLIKIHSSLLGANRDYKRQ